MTIGDSVMCDGDVGVIMQIGNPDLGRNVKIEWMIGLSDGRTYSWEYVSDALQFRQLFLDALKKQ